MATLLHLILHVVEDAVKVDWVELHGHFDRRVLLEVNERLLTLLRVHHPRGTLDSLPLLHRDLLTIEDHQLHQAFDHDHAVVGLSCDRIVDQGEIE